MQKKITFTIICIILIEIILVNISNAAIIDSDNGKMKFYKVDKDHIEFSGKEDDELLTDDDSLLEGDEESDDPNSIDEDENNIDNNENNDGIENDEENNEIENDEEDNGTENEYDTTETDSDEVYEVKQYRGLYDIKGYVNGSLQSTTFDDGGYPAVLKVDDNDPVELDSQTIINGIEWDVECSFINNGQYVKTTYILTNKENVKKNISLGVYVDVQIGENDFATIERFENSKGLRLYSQEDNLQFSFYGKDVVGTTDIDNLWIGTFPKYMYFAFESNNTNIIEDNDSAFTYSWVNRTLEPGATQKYSTIIGMGEVSNAPKIELNENQKNSFYKEDDIKISGIVTDKDKNSKATIYYSIDEGKDISLKEQSLIDNKLDFVLDLTSQNLNVGKHIIKLWAIDESGNPSDVIETDINIIENNNNNNESDNDNTTVITNTITITNNKALLPEKLPYTGFKTIIFTVLIICIIIAIIMKKRYNKYKEL